MHIADNVLAIEDDHKIFAYEAYGSLNHGLGYPYTSILSTTNSPEDYTNICAVKVLWRLGGIGVLVGLDTRDIACNRLGIWICLTNQIIYIVAFFHFNDFGSCRSGSGMNEGLNRVGICQFSEGEVGSIVCLAHILAELGED